MPTTLNNASVFLISTLFDLYIFIVIVRLVLAGIKADFYNPISQFIIKLTQVIVMPLRRIIPNFRRIELASVVLILCLEMLKFSLLGITLGQHIHVLGLIILAGADALKASTNLFFYAILLQAILSWTQAGYSPLAYLLTQITAPIMRPFRRFIPPIAGIDITAIPAMLSLQLCIILIVGPMFMAGQAMAFS